ncbi:hypothetical protein ACFL24_02570 [Patescibacteria group bacterium]
MLKIEKLNNAFIRARACVSFNDNGECVVVGNWRNHENFEINKWLIFYWLDLEGIEGITLYNIFSKKFNDLLKQESPPGDWGIFKQSILRELGKSSQKEYKFFIPVELCFNRGISFPFKKMKLGKITITRCSLQSIKRIFGDLSEFFDLVRRDRLDIKKMTFLLGNSKGISDGHAFDELFNKLNKYRGVYNFSLLFGNVTFRLGGGRLSPLGYFPTPRIYLVRNSSNIKQFLSPFENLYPQPASEFPSRVGKDVNKIPLFRKLKRIIQKKKLTYLENKLIECVVMYAEAFDTSVRSETFINLWRVCENAMSRIDQRSIDITKTLSNYFKTDGEKDLAPMLAKVRNDYVHRGKYFEYSDDIMNYMKKYSEAAVNILLWLINYNFSEHEHLELFYRIYPFYKDKSNQKLIRKLTRVSK